MTEITIEDHWRHIHTGMIVKVIAVKPDSHDAYCSVLYKGEGPYRYGTTGMFTLLDSEETIKSLGWVGKWTQSWRKIEYDEEGRFKNG